MVIELIIDQLTNNETSSDEELVDFLNEETGLKKERLQQMVTEIRSFFLTNLTITEGEAFQLVSKSLRIKK